MRTIRPFFFGTLLLLAPLHATMAQTAGGAKPAAPAPAAPSTKASSGPATTTAAPATAAPSTTAAPATASRYDITTDADAAMNAKSQSLFKDGNTAYRAGKFADARASYKAAYSLDPRNIKILSNLGRAELELQLYRDAAEHLAIGVRLAEASDPKRSGMQAALAESRAKVGAITMKVKSGGAEVDGVEIVDMASGQSYMTPLSDPIFVNAGKASFRIRREGYESQEKVFDLAAGAEQTADVELVRPANLGGGNGSSAGGGGTTGPAPAPRSKLPGFIAGGVGVAALIAGGALVGVSFGKLGDLEAQAPKDASGKPTCGPKASSGEDAKCKDLRSTADSIVTLNSAGVGLLIGGGVVAAGAAIYLLLPSKKASDTKTSRIVPVVSNSGGGFVWTGSF